MVVAAGNENRNAADSSPANCGNVITVAATDRAGNRAFSSSCGTVVDITHTYRGDLVVDLVAPDGSVYRLKSASGSDSADDVDTTCTVNASGETADGTWKLRVQDTASCDTGRLNGWRLTF